MTFFYLILASALMLPWPILMTLSVVRDRRRGRDSFLPHPVMAALAALWLLAWALTMHRIAF